MFFASCDGDVVINLGNIEEPVSAQFQVDFDGETWVADSSSAVINNGIITITAFRNNNQESIIITIQSDQVGTYILDENSNIGEITYAESPTAQLYTSVSPNPVGRIDVTDINTQNQLISGTFFFIGQRNVQQLDSNGNPVLDLNGNPVYDVETKNFTNGIFDNIVYTANIVDPEPDPDTDHFFVKIDGVEFVETSLSATKTDLSTGNSVITIKASRNDSNEVIQLQMPADIFSGNNLLVPIAIDPDDCTATYSILNTSQTFGPESSSSIPLPLLIISLHDTVNKKIKGTFKFTATQTGGGTESYDFEDGEFFVTYTE